MGELAHRGALVTLGYWNDPERTAQRYKPFNLGSGMPLHEIAVWSGDQVKKDEQGFLYFVSRNDEMIKTQGYRVSPNEVEEVLYQNPQVAETVALGISHPTQGQAILAIVYPAKKRPELQTELHNHCREYLPTFMNPARIILTNKPLPRNQNGKLDRKQLSTRYANLLMEFVT